MKRGEVPLHKELLSVEKVPMGFKALLFLIVATLLCVLVIIPCCAVTFAGFVPVYFILDGFGFGREELFNLMIPVAIVASLPFHGMILRKLLSSVWTLESVNGSSELPDVGDEFGRCPNARLDWLRSWCSGLQSLVWLMTWWLMIAIAFWPTQIVLNTWWQSEHDGFRLAAIVWAAINGFVVLQFLGMTFDGTLKWALSRRDIVELYGSVELPFEHQRPKGRINLRRKKRHSTPLTHSKADKPPR